MRDLQVEKKMILNVNQLQRDVLAVGYNGQGGVSPHPAGPGGGRRAEESIQSGPTQLGQIQSRSFYTPEIITFK